MNKQVVFIDAKTGRTSPVHSPATRFKGGTVKWYEDRPKGAERKEQPHDKDQSILRAAGTAAGNHPAAGK